MFIHILLEQLDRLDLDCWKSCLDLSRKFIYLFHSMNQDFTSIIFFLQTLLTPLSSEMAPLMMPTSPPSESSAPSVTSDSGSPVHGTTPPTTNPSTPFNPSLIDLSKLSHRNQEAQPLFAAKNICCVGAGYVGVFESSCFQADLSDRT